MLSRGSKSNGKAVLSALGNPENRKQQNNFSYDNKKYSVLKSYLWYFVIQKLFKTFPLSLDFVRSLLES